MLHYSNFSSLFFVSAITLLLFQSVALRSASESSGDSNADDYSSFSKFFDGLSFLPRIIRPFVDKFVKTNHSLIKQVEEMIQRMKSKTSIFKNLPKFRTLITKILNKFIYMFVEKLDPNDVKISLSKGRIEVDNVFLTKTITKNRNVAMNLVFGYVRRLVLRFSFWKAAKNFFSMKPEAFRANLRWEAEGIVLIFVKNPNVYDSTEREPPIVPSQARDFFRELIHHSEVSAKQIVVRFEKILPNFDRAITITTDFVRFVLNSAWQNYRDEIGKIDEDFVKVFFRSASVDNLSVRKQDDAVIYTQTEEYKRNDREGWLVVANGLLKVVIYEVRNQEQRYEEIEYGILTEESPKGLDMNERHQPDENVTEKKEQHQRESAESKKVMFKKKKKQRMPGAWSDSDESD
ncbi:hypothetical protein Ddc_03763 [Ditylenchus destructor]|nr:hypothetical protein Ddc_03763 [Ditylenchus destructor]